MSNKKIGRNVGVVGVVQCGAYGVECGMGYLSPTTRPHSPESCALRDKVFGGVTPLMSSGFTIIGSGWCTANDFSTHKQNHPTTLALRLLTLDHVEFSSNGISAVFQHSKCFARYRILGVLLVIGPRQHHCSTFFTVDFDQLAKTSQIVYMAIRVVCEMGVDARKWCEVVMMLVIFDSCVWKHWFILSMYTPRGIQIILVTPRKVFNLSSICCCERWGFLPKH